MQKASRDDLKEGRAVRVRGGLLAAIDGCGLFSHPKDLMPIDPRRTSTAG